MYNTQNFYHLADFSTAEFFRRPGDIDNKKRKKRKKKEKVSDIVRTRMYRNMAIGTGIAFPASLLIDKKRFGSELKSLQDDYLSKKTEYDAAIKKWGYKPGSYIYDNMQSRLAKLKKPIKELNAKRFKSHAGVLGAGLIGGAILGHLILDRKEKPINQIMQERRKRTLAYNKKR